ncbi:DUF493 domain-containing protein [Bergeyella cardium]|uniref:DUF493 family protein n=1 Tax=Bergeyella cardium TaxID=1585976 RepID=A0A6P1QTJ3_9FLAO|nr:DUF493 domain-containing protein [Bergeyella cardium]QHN64818.1 DUF493 family protein [Bergeyella cardium]WHE34124.1 DUF493 domain-containing protein [Bergeyella cardium]WHF60775.1 DUF493 domain-containing protein [Bergeyella cardium]
MNVLGLNKTNNPEEFYASLKEKLNEIHNFPEDYLFKFIIPNNQEKLTEIYQVFDGIQTSISNRDSKNGKYISLSISAFVLDADQVIDIYQKVAQIESAIML